jgi:hypothetical protein
VTKGITAQQRRAIERQADDVRMDCLRRGLTIEETVDRIIRAVPDVLPLEAWRFANGWTHAEVGARLDLLYESDGLTPPNLGTANLGSWERGDRRPGDERIEYFCRLYRARPDQLGFGGDRMPGVVGHIQRAGIVDAYPYTCEDSEKDLVDRLSRARSRINMFGLTRNYYAHEEIKPIFEKKADVPIALYIMDPYCASRRDRYRIEPAEAAMEDPERFIRDVLRPLDAMSRRHPRFRVFLYNFPCAFGIEEIDDVCRVMLYGHGKRGTQGPIITFAQGSSSHTYFTDQLRWLERLGSEEPTPEPWASKGLVVRPLSL